VEGQNTLQMQLACTEEEVSWRMENQGTNESFQAGRFQEGARIRASLFSQTAFSHVFSKYRSQSGLKNEQFSLTSPHWMKQIHRPESNIYAIFLGNPWAKSLFGSISTCLIISHHISKF